MLAATQSSAPHFAVREPASMLLTETRAHLLRATREFFEGQGYLEVMTPTISGATGACESVNTVFPVEYFGQKAFLIQTSQLHLEAFVFGAPKVYSVNRSYRAEPKIDDRRLCEFTLVEFEERDMDLEGLMNLEEAYLRHVFQSVRDRLSPAHRKLAESTYARITYTAAVELLKKKGHDISWGEDLSAAHERTLTEELGICFVTHYPEGVKFFNMELSREDPRVVNCCDLLLPIAGESIGGSVREWDHKLLVKRLDTSTMLQQLVERGGTRSDFDWYLELFQDVELHRAGAGIGFERLVQFVTGQSSIKSCVEFVRDAKRLLP